jgi:hypothetical protein
VGTSFPRFKLEITFEKKEKKWSKLTPLKRRGNKEAKEDHNLVANERFQTWWRLEGSKLSGQWGSILFGDQWKVLNLAALGRKRRNIIFTCFHFSPHKILLKFFSIDFRVLFYHGFKSLFCIFPSFSLTYKLQSRISNY